MKIYGERHKPNIRQGVVHSWQESNGIFHCFYRFGGKIGKGQGFTAREAHDKAKNNAKDGGRDASIN